MQKTVVLGLDGATWKLLKPFIEQGILPHLKTIVEKGVHGILESTMPAMTAPSWITFVTGKHPGHHGVFDFMLPVDSLSNMKLATGKDIRDRTLYELLHDAHYKTILLNLPGSYPPRLKDAITITSLLTQGHQWIFPESLKDEFPAFRSWRLTPDENLRLKERREQYLNDLLRHLEEQMICVKWLFEHKPWDFFFYLFSHTDWVSHLAYRELSEYDDPSARRIFEKIDEHLGWFLNHLPDRANLILLSDHGFQAYKKIFYFNRWLENEGYLITKHGKDRFYSAATRRARETEEIRSQKKRIRLGSTLFTLLGRFALLDRLARWTYHHIIKPYLPVQLTVDIGIDFSKTKVCFPKGSYITNAYINKAWVYRDGIVSKEDYVPLRTEVAEKMKQIRDPEGRPVVKKVLTREEVYGPDAPENAPDIFFELNEYWLVGQFHSTKLFGKEIHNKHDPAGIFAAVGPDFASGKELEGLKMQDITPLLLHLLGLPVPSDCDGQVPKQVFIDTSSAKNRPIQKGAPLQIPPTQKQTLRDAIQQMKL